MIDFIKHIYFNSDIIYFLYNNNYIIIYKLVIDMIIKNKIQ